jgi:hypothetical protein
MIKATINNIDVEVPEGTIILGATGGVMEEAIRSAYFLITSRELENLSVKALYENFFERPNSEKAHKLLHTNFMKRSPADGKVINE